MELPDTIRITAEVAQVLESLAIPYFVGGSLASSIHGIPRSTLDSDLVATLIEQVTGTLEEQHAEDVFLVLTGIHVPAQVVASCQQQAFEARVAAISEAWARGDLAPC